MPPRSTRRSVRSSTQRRPGWFTPTSSIARRPAPGSPHGARSAAVTDAAVIIWTSGTTGVPKGAWFDHRGLHAAVASAGAMSAPYDVKLVATPFPHAGYMAKLWDQLAWVTTSVIAPTPWRADEMLRLLVDERITVAAGVPTQWAKLLEQPGIADADLSRVRLGLAATAPAPPELVERVAAAIGCPLVVRYAMTESPTITGTEPGDPPEVQFRTVGRPQAGMQIEIADGDGARPRRAGARARRVRDARLLGRPRAHGGDASTPTAGSPAPTSACCAPTATSCSSAAPATCTSAAATTCTRSRSRTCSPSTRRSIAPRWSACRRR